MAKTKGYIVTVDIFVPKEDAEDWLDTRPFLDDKEEAASLIVQTELEETFGYEVKNVRKYGPA